MARAVTEIIIAFQMMAIFAVACEILRQTAFCKFNQVYLYSYGNSCSFRLLLHRIAGNSKAESVRCIACIWLYFQTSFKFYFTNGVDRCLFVCLNFTNNHVYCLIKINLILVH